MMKMRKGKQYIMLIMVGIMLLLSGCNGKNGEEETTFVSQFGFETRGAVLEGENGWVYYYAVDYAKGTLEEIYGGYNSYNLKYMNGEFGGTYSYLDEISVGGWPEYMETVEANERDLKKELRDIAMASEYMAEGQYYYLPEAGFLWDDSLSGYKWQVGYFIIHGMIGSIDIELIYDDGTYLKDKVKAGTANDEEKTVADMIFAMENNIMETQSMVAGCKEYSDSENDYYNRLMKILESLEKGEYRR